MPGVAGRSGGARQGAGRKAKVKTVSERTKTAILKAARELAKEYGEPLEKSMLRLCYDPKTQDTVKASVFKSYLEAMVSKEVDQKITGNIVSGPAIGLPPAKEDPALKIINGGGK